MFQSVEENSFVVNFRVILSYTKNVVAIDKFGKDAKEQDISNSVKLYEMGKEE